MPFTSEHLRAIPVALLALGAACGAPGETASTSADASAVALPSRFTADRIYAMVPTRGGDTLNLYTDTGGGLFVSRDAARRIGWQDTTSLDLSQVATDSQFPDPLGTPDHRVPIFQPPANPLGDFDGMLGQAWFADRIWTFDYTAKELLLHQAAPAIPSGAATVPLGFRADSTGRRALSFPRIVAVVDGDTLQLLFDTGATGFLSAQAMSALGDGAPAVRATSFISSEVLNRWRQRHSDWRILENADDIIAGMRMIEVPEITVAGFAVGPVWFTERPDRNFHEFMSQFMDRRVDGALGGNAFRFFRITVDYPAAVAHFVPRRG